MVKSNILLMSGLVFVLALGSKAQAGKDLVWGPMDAYVTRIPVKKKPAPASKHPSDFEVRIEQIKFSSAMEGNLSGLTPFQKAYALKHQ